MPSKAGSWELVQCQSQLSSSSPWLLVLPRVPFCPEAVGVGDCVKDRGPAVLLVAGIRTWEPEGLGSNPASTT